MPKESPSSPRKRFKPGQPFYGICRAEPRPSGSGGHWFVGLHRMGTDYSARFYDLAYPSAGHALRAAQAFRDALLERLPDQSARWMVPAKRYDGSVRGVARHLKNGRAYWWATYTVNGKRRKQSFSVAKHGEEGARRLALETRTAWLNEIGGERQLPSKEEVKQIAQDIRARFGEKKPNWPTRVLPYHADDSMYGIFRYEANARGKCGHWNVSLIRRRVTYSKHFSDAVHGGKEQALVAARRWRDEVLASVEPLSKREYQQIRTQRNTSGVAGVSWTRKDGVELYCRATIRLPGKQDQQKCFSVKKYGRERAFALAVQAREAMLAQVQGAYVFSPAAIKRHAAIESNGDAAQASNA